MKLINLQQHRQKEVVSALEALLLAAKDGHVEGLVYMIQIGQSDHRAGTSGTYRRHPEKALQATFQLERMLASGTPFASSM